MTTHYASMVLNENCIQHIGYNIYNINLYYKLLAASFKRDNGIQVVLFFKLTQNKTEKEICKSSDYPSKVPGIDYTVHACIHLLTILVHAL